VYFPDDSTSGTMYSGQIERWDDRADYFGKAFKMLVGAGWSVHVRDRSGKCVLDRLVAAEKSAQRLVSNNLCNNLAGAASCPRLAAAHDESIEKVLEGRRKLLAVFSNMHAYAKAKG
jgi:hypothetical protein